jgi:hypothetical protein
MVPISVAQTARTVIDLAQSLRDAWVERAALSRRPSSALRSH